MDLPSLSLLLVRSCSWSMTTPWYNGHRKKSALSVSSLSFLRGRKRKRAEGGEKRRWKTGCCCFLGRGISRVLLSLFFTRSLVKSLHIYLFHISFWPPKNRRDDFLPRKSIHCYVSWEGGKRKRAKNIRTRWIEDMDVGSFRPRNCTAKIHTWLIAAVERLKCFAL